MYVFAYGMSSFDAIFENDLCNWNSKLGGLEVALLLGCTDAIYKLKINVPKYRYHPYSHSPYT